MAKSEVKVTLPVTVATSEFTTSDGHRLFEVASGSTMQPPAGLHVPTTLPPQAVTGGQEALSVMTTVCPAGAASAAASLPPSPAKFADETPPHPTKPKRTALIRRMFMRRSHSKRHS